MPKVTPVKWSPIPSKPVYAPGDVSGSYAVAVSVQKRRIANDSSSGVEPNGHGGGSTYRVHAGQTEPPREIARRRCRAVLIEPRQEQWDPHGHNRDQQH